MITSTIIIKAIFSAIGLLALSILTGKLLERLGNAKQKKSAGLFEPLITGLLMIVSLYAIVITGGRTILLPIVLLIIVAGYLKDEKRRASLFSHITYVPKMLTLTILLTDGTPVLCVDG